MANTSFSAPTWLQILGTLAVNIPFICIVGDWESAPTYSTRVSVGVPMAGEETTPSPSVDVSALRGLPRESLARCQSAAPLFDRLRQKHCPQMEVAEMCATWYGESRMCLGAPLGEACKVSSAGARGPFQQRWDYARSHGVDEDGGGYNSESLSDAAASYLSGMCAYIAKAGSKDEAIRGYAGGIYARTDPGEVVGGWMKSGLTQTQALDRLRRKNAETADYLNKWKHKSEEFRSYLGQSYVAYNH